MAQGEPLSTSVQGILPGSENVFWALFRVPPLNDVLLRPIPFADPSSRYRGQC
jgi:hypothetical protein